MHIGGFQRFSLIEYPTKISAIVFTQGCNFRCPYCHNPELVDPRFFEQPIAEEAVFSFLEKRKGKIDAISITGGEPTLQEDLTEFIRRIKSMGYLVKLDTNGSNPEVLEQIIGEGLVDYIAMDIKAPLSRYREVVEREIDGEIIRKSIDIIASSGVSYEFRTTLVKPLLSKQDILDIGKTIKGIRNYILQRFVPSKTLANGTLKLSPFPMAEMELLREELRRHGVGCILR